MRFGILLLPLFMAAQGCQTSPRQIDADYVEVGESILLTLPEPKDMTESFDATQILAATFDGETYNLQVQLEWRPGSIVLAGLSTFGTTLFSIGYDGSRFESQGSRMITQRLRPEYVLADILLTLWDAERVRTQLRGTGLQVSEENGSRVLSRNGMPVIIISYEGASLWEGPVRYEHLERGYTLDILTVGFNGS